MSQQIDAHLTGLTECFRVCCRGDPDGYLRLERPRYRLHADFLAMRIDGKEQIVGRFSAKNTQKLTGQRAALEASWRALGGSRLCLSANCNEPVEVALPPLPDYRPAQLREDKAPTLMQLLSQISG